MTNFLIEKKCAHFFPIILVPSLKTKSVHISPHRGTISSQMSGVTANLEFTPGKGPVTLYVIFSHGKDSTTVITLSLSFFPVRLEIAAAPSDFEVISTNPYPFD